VICITSSILLDFSQGEWNKDVRFLPPTLLIEITCKFEITMLYGCLPLMTPGAGFMVFAPTAAETFKIARAQSVYTAHDVISETNARNAFEIEDSETLYLENHTGQGR